LITSAAKYEIRIHGCLLMTNHVHLLLTRTRDDPVSKLLQYLGQFCY
jgi:REP element-mobilizing transposase RayT